MSAKKQSVFGFLSRLLLSTQRYMKPLLTHSRPTLLETLPVCCNPIARLLTTTQQLTQVSCAVQQEDDRILIDSDSFQDGSEFRRVDSDSDICIDNDTGNGLSQDGSGAAPGVGRRNSLSRVSIKYTADNHHLLASYRNIE